jgi:hypothetical protein
MGQCPDSDYGSLNTFVCHGLAHDGLGPEIKMDLTSQVVDKLVTEEVKIDNVVLLKKDRSQAGPQKVL